MKPTETQLLHHLQTSVERIRQITQEADVARLANALRAGLAELLQRTDKDFYCDYYRRGLALAKRGESLARQRQAPPECTRSGLREALSPQLHRDAIDDAIDDLSDHLTTLVAAVRSSKGPEERQFLDDVCTWEGEIDARRARMSAASVARSTDSSFTAPRMLDYLRHKFPGLEVDTLDEFRVLSGGFSKTTILVAATSAHGSRESIVVRADKTRPVHMIAGADISHEYALIKFLFESGFPVAEPLWLEEDRAQFGVKFLVSRRVEGENIGSAHTHQTTRPIDTDIKRHLVKSLLQIHQLPLDANARTFLQQTYVGEWFDVHDSYAAATARFWREEISRQGSTMTPRTQRIYDWLRSNAPASVSRPVLVHGDYGLHNVLFKGSDVVAVLDWEIAKLGDPEEDFAILFLSMGIDSDDEIIALYEAMGGQQISRYRIRFYGVLLLLRVLVFKATLLKTLQLESDPDMILYPYLMESVFLQLEHFNEAIASLEQLQPGA